MIKHKKIMMGFLIVGAVVVSVGLGTAGFFLYEKTIYFNENTFLNGEDISGMTAEEAIQKISLAYQQIPVQIEESGATAFSSDLQTIGYSVNMGDLYKSVITLLKDQDKNLLDRHETATQYQIEILLDQDAALFEKEITVGNLFTVRYPSENASLEYDGSEYYIKPEVYGNEMSDDSLHSVVQEAVTAGIPDTAQGAAITAVIPESCYYLPEVFQTDERMNATMNLYNQYCKASITYTFGEQTQNLDWNTIQNWLTEDGTLSSEAVSTYIADMAAQYDTIYDTRTFTTSNGTEITLDSNDYGYRIDQEGEYNQLLSDIYANTETTREPVYSISGFSRNGKDDINGNYVEVNLAAQHLWFYRNGALVIESDIVSGMPSTGHATTTGAFPIAYKVSPFQLQGGGGSTSSWDVTVQYWMPFYDGQGLHDASWKATFGGSTYLTDGSHGCVNLPPAVAQVVYENMEAGIPVLLYQ